MQGAPDSTPGSGCRQVLLSRFFPFIDIALLQTYIVQRQKAGFHDMERMLEALSIHMFRALSIGELVNKNQLNNRSEM